MATSNSPTPRWSWDEINRAVEPSWFVLAVEETVTKKGRANNWAKDGLPAKLPGGIYLATGGGVRGGHRGSGGNTNRPALKRLLADVEDGRIDVVVVYKIDRLSRSLSDFAKMVDLFDERGVTFVSVTQQFNTTTSMGHGAADAEHPAVFCPV